MKTIAQVLDSAPCASGPASRTLSITTIHPVDRSAATDRLKHARGLVDRLYSEIGRRWQGQAVWTQDPENRAAGARALSEQSPTPTWEALSRALGALSAKPYPPNIGSILFVACAPTVAEDVARKALREAISASSTGEWWTLDSASWQASLRIGWGRLRMCPESGRHAAEFFREWYRALTDAADHPDPAVISRQPTTPQRRLPPTDEERTRSDQAARKTLDDIAAFLKMRG